MKLFFLPQQGQNFYCCNHRLVLKRDWVLHLVTDLTPVILGNGSQQNFRKGNKKLRRQSLKFVRMWQQFAAILMLSQSKTSRKADLQYESCTCNLNPTFTQLLTFWKPNIQKKICFSFAILHL